jgi:hypothetical protein
MRSLLVMAILLNLSAACSKPPAARAQSQQVRRLLPHRRAMRRRYICQPVTLDMWSSIRPTRLFRYRHTRQPSLLLIGSRCQ